MKIGQGGQMNINILIDASGSMVENGKISIVKYVINAAVGYSKADGSMDLSLYQWGDSIERLNSLGEYRVQGGRSEGSIADFMEAHSEENLLIISDGGFSSKTKKDFRKIQNKENVFFLGVGCDCNFSAIRSLIEKENIFRAQDAITCLRNMTYVEK